MDKLNGILKNIVLFLAVFLLLQYFFSSCENEQTPGSNNLIFETTKDEYSRVQLVTVDLENQTLEEIVIESECPNEPFSVYRYENNEWMQKTVSPEISCENAVATTVAPGAKTRITYESWNNALFGELGRYRIELTTTVNGEEKTISTNEFEIVKEGLFKQLWYGIFYRPIYNALIFFTVVAPGHSLGIAIILLTLIIRTILLIPSQKAMKAQKKMQDLQPRLEKLKQKYKGDQQKIAMETMALYKETKVSPLGGCLPILLQFPFLIALFYAVRSGLNPDNSFMLYSEYTNFTFHDIGVHFLGLDLTKPNLYVLPIIIGGLQFGQMKLSMAKKAKKEDNKKEKKKDEMAMATSTMTYVMPVMIAVFTASLPAGVGIYWGTSTTYGIVQQLFVNKSPNKEPNEPTVRVIKNN